MNARNDGYRYRLPTEAEWEYAARAGTPGTYAGNLDDMAWYDKNSNGQTHPVGQKKANAWGLYDMHGNVWEWVEDWYGNYSAGPATDPKGPATGSSRVVRGGSWYVFSEVVRVSYRPDYDPDSWDPSIGFRLLRERS